MITANEKQWFAVYCKSHQEERAKTGLTQKSIEVFYPQLYLPNEPREQRRYIPLFNGYIFVKFALAGEFNDVRWVPGVRYILPKHCPEPIEEGIIHSLKNPADDEGILQAYLEVNVGEKVVIHYGPFAGHEGVLLDPTKGKERVNMLLDCLGRQVKATVPVEVLRLRWKYEQPIRR